MSVSQQQMRVNQNHRVGQVIIQSNQVVNQLLVQLIEKSNVIESEVDSHASGGLYDKSYGVKESMSQMW